jgi:Rps23 Pro-64 3,4-dihydroxylase Tpa1-like proline 4-hydroxylase
VDLKDKIVTHVFYFNRAWDKTDGGCLTILRSPSMADVVADVAPLLGNSSVLVRSDKSWHAVSRVVEGCRRSRRSMTVTFYHPGSLSTMWPPGDASPLRLRPGGRRRLAPATS